MLITNKIEIEEREIIPGFKGRFIHTENLTVVHWSINAGASLQEHSHPHEQVTNLIEGEFEFTLDGEVTKLTAGGVVAIPSDVKHSAKAITDCYVVDVFYPVREDYKK
ncbi:MAG: cupin domain-containing protein [Candidatus Hodarchaeales archaeon]|jgi:quercetin dioxygenase-like cupin family protein